MIDNIRQCTNAVVVARPHHFDFNPETASDNLFQSPSPIADLSNFKSKVMDEFDNFVESLRQAGIWVSILDDKEAPQAKLIDSLFPNNWFSTNRFGVIQIFPMMAANRQAEVRPELLWELLEKDGFRVDGIVDHRAKLNGVLEGTGSMVMDHYNNTLYAALSCRCEWDALRSFKEQSVWEIGYCFETADGNGRPIYHTNVLLSIGKDFAVLCDEAIPDAEDRRQLLDILSQDREVILINLDQMNQFCANILQLENDRGESLIVMSNTALKGFNGYQLDSLSKYGRLLDIPIPLIEKVGGGSIRCMLAENFLPRIA